MKSSRHRQPCHFKMKKKRKVSATPSKKVKKKKFTRLDVAIKKDKDRFFNKTVVKCTLQPFCKFKVVQREIEECVFYLSRLQIHAHHVMHLLLLRNGGAFRDDKDESLYELYNKIYRHLANHLQQKKERKDVDTNLRDLCKEYCDEVALERDWPQGCVSGWRDRTIEQMAQQSSVMHTTHLETNLNVYTLRYLRYLLFRDDTDFDQIKNLSKKKFGQVFSAITQAFWERTKVSDIVERRPSLTEFASDVSVWDEAQRALDIICSLVPKTTTLSEKSRICFFILGHLEPFVESLQQRFRNGEFEGKKSILGRQKWTFCLCPQMAWKPKHIHISSTAVKTMVEQLAKKYPYIRKIVDDCPALDDYTNKYYYWKSIFNMKRVLKKKHMKDQKKLRFGCSICTDGVSVSAVIDTVKSDLECTIIHLQDDMNYVKAKLWATYCGMFATNIIAKKIRYDPLRILLGDISTIHYVLLKPLLHTLKSQKDVLQKRKAKNKDKTVITERIKRLAGIRKDDHGIYHTDCIIVGLDPGKKSAATWVFHDSEKQKIHAKWNAENGRHTEVEDRYKSDSLGSGEWIFLSSQKQYTAKMKKRMSEYCPAWVSVPTCKTVDLEKIFESYRFQVSMWPQLQQAFFDDKKWYQKQKMRKFCKEKSAMEDVVARICGTRNKEAQKRVIVAYGDGDNNGTMRGTAPIMSTKLFNKVSECATVVLVNEFNTSKLCSCCHEAMEQYNKQFRMKRCHNNECIRNVWDRDVNASINIKDLFLEKCYNGSRIKAFKRTRKRQRTSTRQ